MKKAMGSTGGLCLICTVPLLTSHSSGSFPLPSQDIMDLITNLFKIPSSHLSTLSDSLELCSFCQVILQEASHLMEDILRFQSRLEFIGVAVRQKIMTTNTNEHPLIIRKTRSDTSSRRQGEFSTFRETLIKCWDPSETQIPVDPLSIEHPTTSVLGVEGLQDVPDHTSPDENNVSQNDEVVRQSVSSIKLETEGIRVVAIPAPEPHQEVNVDDVLPGCSWQVCESSTIPPVVDPLKEEVVWELIESDVPGTIVPDLEDESVLGDSVATSVFLQRSFDRELDPSETSKPDVTVRTKRMSQGRSSKKRARHMCKCPDCGKLFRDSHDLGRHRVTIHDPNPEIYTCHVCGKLFKCKQYLQKHMHRHGDQPAVFHSSEKTQT